MPTRRTLLAAATFALLPTSDAFAGKGWCRMDPWALFDGKLIEFYGDAFTEFDKIVYDSAIFTITKPRGAHTFELVEPFPVCEVRVNNEPYAGDDNAWVIGFEFMTTNGDHKGRIQTIQHDPSPIYSTIKKFTHYRGEIVFPL